jgi:hypothetical protein
LSHKYGRPRPGQGVIAAGRAVGRDEQDGRRGGLLIDVFRVDAGAAQVEGPPTEEDELVVVRL